MLQLRFSVQREQRLCIYDTDYVKKRDRDRDPKRMHHEPDCVPDYAWWRLL